MHGNTIKSANGFKTRPFNNVVKEVKRVFAVHKTPNIQRILFKPYLNN